MSGLVYMWSLHAIVYPTIEATVLYKHMCLHTQAIIKPRLCQFNFQIGKLC